MRLYSWLTTIVICRYVNAQNWGDVSRALRWSMSLNDIDYLVALETANRPGNSIVPGVRRLIFSNSGDIEEAQGWEYSNPRWKSKTRKFQTVSERRGSGFNQRLIEGAVQFRFKCYRPLCHGLCFHWILHLEKLSDLQMHYRVDLAVSQLTDDKMGCEQILSLTSHK